MMCKTDEKTRNFLPRAELSQRSEKIENKLIIEFRGQKRNQLQQEFHSCTITANIWENNEK